MSAPEKSIYRTRRLFWSSRKHVVLKERAIHARYIAHLYNYFRIKEGMHNKDN